MKLSKDFEKVERCPLCAVSSELTKPMLTHGAPIAEIELHGLTIPVAFYLPYSQCQMCGMIYQNPRLTDEARYRFYTEGLYQSLIKHEFKTEAARAERLMKHIDKLNGKSILDIGCGHGELLQACQNSGFERAAGFDLFDYALDGIEVITDDSSLRGEKFDIVTMIHTLEHTVNPILELLSATFYANHYVIVEVPLHDPTDNTRHNLNLPHTLIFAPWTLSYLFARAELRIKFVEVSVKHLLMIGEK